MAWGDQDRIGNVSGGAESESSACADAMLNRHTDY